MRKCNILHYFMLQYLNPLRGKITISFSTAKPCPGGIGYCRKLSKQIALYLGLARRQTMLEYITALKGLNLLKINVYDICFII